MSIGKRIRMNRLFSQPSGRLFAVAVDHFINYHLQELPPGLRQMSRTLELIVKGRPDAVTMHRGIAESAWLPFAGKVPFILQSTLARPDDTAFERVADAEDALRMGAEAIAVVAFVRGANEGRALRAISDCVKDAARFDIPVVAHIYPRKLEGEPGISFEPEGIAWAVRCGLELGVDIIKVPYCNDVAAYGQIVSECPVPVVAAGGPRAETLSEALAMLRDVVKSGARGATVGRNVWGFPRITEAVLAIRAVIHDERTPEEAMKLAGLG